MSDYLRRLAVEYWIMMHKNKEQNTMEATFGFLLFDQLEELDLVGPWEMIGLWCKEFGGPNNLITVSQTGGLITCSKGLKIASDFSFENSPSLDYLLIPGGMGTRTEVNNKKIIQFIQTQAEHCSVIASVCTGSFLLQAAGLLTNTKATTHWKSLERLKQFPEVKVVEKRFVKDGNIWTSAGISAGTDMALAIIEDLAGNETAGKVQLHAEYFPSSQLYADISNIKELPEYLKD
jgi:transcriptional regulator GlxA family with amidase domain